MAPKNCIFPFQMWNQIKYSLFVLGFSLRMGSAFAQTAPEVPEYRQNACPDFDLCLSAGAYGGMGTFTCPHEEAVITAWNTTCPDSDDGFLIANVSGGKQPYEIRWSTGETGQRISNLPPGSYSVTITDADGCRIERQTRITAAPMPEIDWDISHPDMRNKRNPGPAQINVTVSGTDACYQFRWDGATTVSNPILLNASPGAHSIEITDHNGCVYRREIFVE